MGQLEVYHPDDLHQSKNQKRTKLDEEETGDR
jgi:hypothetical protein